MLLTILLLGAMGGAAAHAAEPPDQDDPCSRGGKNTCGTNGKGSYRAYEFGPRWFGDFRGAVPGVDGATFCIDLRFWYPSRSFGYEKRSAEGLRNRDGDALSASSLRRMNYAMWRFGRSDSASQQAAVMLFVHRLMGDGAPGEVTPRALSSRSRSIFRRIQREVKRYAGPYRVRATLPEGMVAGREAELEVQVLGAAGRPVPDVEVTLSGTGAEGLPERVDTGSSGVARVSFTPTDPGAGVQLRARAGALPADLPTLFAPSKRKPARNAQRLVAPAGQSVAVESNAPVKAAPQVVTQVSAQSVTPGARITDTVKVSGLAGQTVTVQAALYGPYPSRDAMTCEDTPVWTGSITAGADGDYVTAPVTLTVPGYYTYRESIAESDTVTGVETPCGEASETTIVRGAPAIRTQISAQESTPGSEVTDTAVVSGLGRLAATVQVELWGPYASPQEISCQGEPFWTGTFEAAGDGSYVTEPVKLGAAGYYTYRESIVATEAYAGVQTACGEAAETTFAKAAPEVETIVSDFVVKPGRKLHDRIKVTGLGDTPARIEVELFGPYSTRADIDCGGRPYWSGTVEAKGDGTVRSPSVTIRKAGFYTYVERIAGTPSTTGTETKCAIEAETSLGRPLIVTGRGDRVAEVVSAQNGDDRPQPRRVEVPSLGISAPVQPSGIDLKAGAMGTPSDIDRVGWFRDGAAPGDERGAVLLAGHRDSARRGAGAFYAIEQAR
ncbi:MAG: hypothetical protein ABWZ67_13905, partial [Solirubrobacteraceae bacterium]